MAAVPMPCTDVLADARFLGRSRDGLYEPVLADIEREAVADLLQYLENVRFSASWMPGCRDLIRLY